MYRVGTKIPTIAYILCGLLLILADMLFWAQIAHAAPTYTPYANSVAAQSGLGGGTSGNAVGEPNGQSASFLGLNASLTLDMGDGEEGTNTLKVYLGAINVQAQVRVEFLDDNQAVISQETRQLFLDLSASTQTFSYDWNDSDKAYRFVRITTLAAIALGVDSIEALGFIGSSTTQDTDGDGTPDREDGTPLTPNEKPGGGGGGSGGSGGGGSGGGSNTTTTQTVVRNTTNTTRAGSTPTVNDPASSANDKDGDQMDDAWELKYGLDPTDKADALEDPDKDGLTNVREYQLDTSPRSADTDNDGIPDGWEVANGLNAKVDDAEQDPDFDYITNRGEAYMDVNPYVADTFAALAAKLDSRPRMMNLFLWLVVLVVALIAWWRVRKLIAVVARRTVQGKRANKRNRNSKSSLPPF